MWSQPTHAYRFAAGEFVKMWSSPEGFVTLDAHSTPRTSADATRHEMPWRPAKFAAQIAGVLELNRGDGSCDSPPKSAH